MRKSLLVVTFAAACTSQPTRIDLHVTADPTLAVDDYEIDVGGISTRADLASSFDLEVSDQMAGHAATIEVWGMRDGQQVAHASTTVTPVRGKVVATTLTLFAIGCTGADCNPPVGCTTDDMCGTPPADSCTSMTTLTTYAAGTCNLTTHTCDFAPSAEKCKAGCEHAACLTWTQVSAGADIACGLRSNGSVLCWGDQTTGTLTVPDGVYTAISSRGETACAIATDHTLTCWGDNTTGLLAAPSGTFKSVGVTMNYGCAIRTDDTVACWGAALDLGPLVTPSGAFQSLAVGDFDVCGITTSGETVCWTNAMDAASLVLAIPTAEQSAVAMGFEHACSIAAATGAIDCWSYTEDPSKVPTPPAGAFKALDVNNKYHLALRANGTVTAFGSGLAANSGTYDQIAVGWTGSACGIDGDGGLTCWGDNVAGESDVPLQ